MIVIVICAAMTALFTLMILRPLARAGRMREAFFLAPIIAAAALGLYLYYGHPDAGSSPALYETEGPRAEHRALTARELTLMQALADDQENTGLMKDLGNTQMRAGRLDEAARTLEHALTVAPDDQDIRAELGAAYYAQGVRMLMDERQEDALPYLEKALQTAPPHVEYRGRLEQTVKDLKKPAP